MFPVIEIGVVRIPVYTALFMLGFAIMIIMARRIAERYNYPKADILYVSLYAGIGIFLGAKLMYFISKLPAIVAKFDVYIEYWKNEPMGAFNYSFGGLVFYGGLIGALLGAYIYCRQYKMPFHTLTDIFAPLIPFVHGIGRIGCFMAGCCYGKEYHGFGCVQFPANKLIPVLDDVPRIPVQLIEAGLNFAVAGVLFVLMKKVKLKSGQLMGIYILYYTVARFLLEMLRGDAARGNVGGVSTSQIISVILLPIGIALVSGKFSKNLA
ncbi:MAG: prolipoprotein diacylglyceryl transferase [Lachnospiraceae bacterium]|nr:prolipoprotein diacylglyceryl transferase [Lachnospiraceae bacterium]